MNGTRTSEQKKVIDAFMKEPGLYDHSYSIDGVRYFHLKTGAVIVIGWDLMPKVDTMPLMSTGLHEEREYERSRVWKRKATNFVEDKLQRTRSLSRKSNERRIPKIECAHLDDFVERAHPHVQAMKKDPNLIVGWEHEGDRTYFANAFGTVVECGSNGNVRVLADSGEEMHVEYRNPLWKKDARIIRQEKPRKMLLRSYQDVTDALYGIASGEHKAADYHLTKGTIFVKGELNDVQRIHDLSGGKQGVREARTEVDSYLVRSQEALSRLKGYRQQQEAMPNGLCRELPDGWKSVPMAKSDGRGYQQTETHFPTLPVVQAPSYTNATPRQALATLIATFSRAVR